MAQNGELEHVADTPYLWAELRWACRDEGVLHLEDLLLRRLRIGLLLANGGAEIMERVRMIVQSELAWDDARWAAEAAAYADTWERSYRVPL